MLPPGSMAAQTAFGETRKIKRNLQLAVRTPLGNLRLKLPAGDAVAYPATTMHRVEPVTSGTRRVAITWIQSLITTAEHRERLLSG